MSYVVACMYVGLHCALFHYIVYCIFCAKNVIFSLLRVVLL